MAKQLTLELTHSKTYATVANLERAVEKATWLGDKARYIVLPTPEGRFTPVFMAASLQEGFGIVQCASNGWHVVS